MGLVDGTVRPVAHGAPPIPESLYSGIGPIFSERTVMLKWFRKYNKYIPRITKGLIVPKHHSNMMCLHYFLNKPVDDCRARICFSLASNLIKTKGAQETRDILHSWNRKIINGYLRPSQIEGVINSVTKKNIPTGCNYNTQLLRELNLTQVCDYCQYKKSRDSI